MRKREYQKRQKLKTSCPSDVLFLDGPKPIAISDIISALIESEQIDHIARKMESIIEKQAEIYKELDGITDNEIKREELRKRESSVQMNEYETFLITTQIRNILLDFIKRKAEEEKDRLP